MSKQVGRRHKGMPFCGQKKHRTQLQILRRQDGRRVSLCVFCKGSITLEAALAVPLFLCVITALLYLFAFTSVQAKESRKLMERAELLAVTIRESEDPYIRLYDAATITPPFSGLFFKGKLLFRKAEVRAWVGYTKETFETKDQEEIVYLTPEGEVCHKSMDCSYLKLSIRSISIGSITEERNLSGGKYLACEYCIKKGFSGNTVYITDYGNSYHSTASCRGLKRTIMAVPYSKAGGRRLCSRCGK